jgi:tetratricopeptide repeat protein/glycosyl transferase family 9 (putative heptosyltransferase)
MVAGCAEARSEFRGRRVRAYELFEKGVAAKAAQRFNEAAELFGQVVALTPRFAEARLNLGNVLTRLGDPEAAIVHYQTVLQQAPDYALAEMNLGVALTALNRHDEAISAYDRALAADPAFKEAEYRKALQLLRLGRFDEGWPLHEARWDCASHMSRPYGDKPYWTGEEDIAGETLLVYAEQGLGDTLQFCRYLPLIAARGAQVVLHVDTALWPLLEGSPGVQALVKEGDVQPAFSRHVSLMSLPLAFRTTVETIPSPRAYLAAPEERVRRWADRLPRTARRRIGLAWSGNPEHHDDHNRSIPTDVVLGLAQAGVEIVCLQTQLRDGDAAAMDRAGVVNLAGEIGDFGDTAALATSCDLVISVDTSIAHLAGALGLPVWILLPCSADWRWMTDEALCPWHPTAKLFRQRRIGDWPEVLRRVESALHAWAEV